MKLGPGLDRVPLRGGVRVEAELAQELRGVGQLGLTDVEAREGPSLQLQHGAAVGREDQRSCRAGGPRTDDDDVDLVREVVAEIVPEIGKSCSLLGGRRPLVIPGLLAALL